MEITVAIIAILLHRMIAWKKFKLKHKTATFNLGTWLLENWLSFVISVGFTLVLLMMSGDVMKMTKLWLGVTPNLVYAFCAGFMPHHFINFGLKYLKSKLK